MCGCTGTFTNPKQNIHNAAIVNNVKHEGRKTCKLACK